MPAYSIRDYVNLPKPDTTWIWRGIIPHSGAALVFGHAKTGKSKLILGLAEAVANPTIPNFLGLPINEHGKVLYIQLDTPRSLWIEGYLSCVKSEAAIDNIFIIDRELPDRPNPFDIRDSICQEWIRREVDVVQPIMVIVDTVRRMHRGDENDPTVMSLVYDTFINITQPAALVLLTHKKKQQDGDVGFGTARGSTVLMGAVDALVNMTKTALYIEARSDVEEEIPIHQLDDGTFMLNSKEESIGTFLSSLGDGMSKSEVNNALMEKFNISERTAKRWRKNYTEVGG